MTRIAGLLGLMLVTGLVVGCNGNSPSARRADDKLSVNPAVTDITPVSAPVAPAPAVQPQPVVYDTVQPEPAAAAEEISAPAPVRTRSSRSTASAAGGTKYKVRKGDTLWKIAQAHYGNGAKWQRIASANPKVDPNHVLAGQTIVIP